MHASQSDSECVYFYFDFNDMQKQTVDTFLRSILVQICACRQDFVTHIGPLFEKCNDGAQHPSQGSLVKILDTLLSGPRHTYLIIDALDECMERTGMSELLKKLIISRNNLNVLLTSRFEQDIKLILLDSIDIITLIQSIEVKCDVELYVRKQLNEDPRLKCCRQIRDEALLKLVEGADGMYVCYLSF